ncbi:MAG: quinolinate synthase NadA [Deltaproteobacteria bacterium]|nr:quinolinate synthase NadA [Deltaproteobacteria bacterium]
MGSNLVEQIDELRLERKALILAHNYQPPEIQDVADFTGDSLELSRRAAATDARLIVFCGVHFMAETAKILSPEKIVLLPDAHAGCPMADMITPEQLAAEKAKHPGVQVVSYVNSSAAVKAEADICCTSANAAHVVSSLGDGRPILFVPDQYLGHYVMRKTGRDLILWPGYCPTHAKITAEDVEQKRVRYPEARVLVHPECRPEVIDGADEALSTGGMLRYARDYNGKMLLIGTETGILHPLRKVNPRVEYEAITRKSICAITRKSICPNMKRISLEKVLRALEELEPRIEVPAKIRKKALMAVDKMLAL